MRLFRRIIWSCYLLLWLCAAALWGRSYWKTDDILLTYDGDGSVHARLDRGVVTFVHASPTRAGNQHAIQRVKLISTSQQSQPPEMPASQSYVTHKGWLNYRLDWTTSAQIASLQTAHAARVLGANRAAFAAARASDLATRDFEDAGAWANRANFTERQKVAIAYWQMQAARQHAAVMRAAQAQIAAAGVQSLTPQWQVSFPAWVLLALACIPVGIPLLRIVARHGRSRRGLCGHCGYDLQANTSGVCPECGTRVEVILCRSISVDGKRVLSIRPATPATAIGSRSSFIAEQQ